MRFTEKESAEAVNLIARLIKALQNERDYWMNEITDAATGVKYGVPYTDAVKARIKYCTERVERLNKVIRGKKKS